MRGPDSRPTPGQGERIHQREGHCLQGSLEPRCPRKIFTCICHAGAGPGPSGTLGPHLGVRRSVHFVGFYLQERAWGSQVQGDGCQVKSRGTEEATPALGSEDGSAPRTPGTPIRRPAAPQAPQTSTAGPQSPGLAATCRLRAFQARSPDQPPTPTPGVGGQSLGLEVTVKVTALSPSQPRLQEGLKPPPTWNLLCFQEVPGPPRAPPRGAPGCLRTCLDRPGMHHPCFCRGGAAVAPAHIALCRAPAHPSNPAPLGPLHQSSWPGAFGLLRLLNFKRIKPEPGSALGLGLRAQDPQPLVSNAKDTEESGQGREAKPLAPSPKPALPSLGL